MADKTLNAKSFGIAAGIFWGIVLFSVTLISAYTGYGAGFLNIVKSIYPGYGISIVGGLVGLVYGFIDGLIGCFIFIKLYNFLAEKLK